MQMTKYVIGVDGGGTKTDVVLVSHKGSIIGRTLGSSTNYQAIGGEKLKFKINSLIEKLLKGTNVKENEISRLLLGLAGAGRKSDQVTIKKCFDDTEFKEKMTVESDAKIALVGAFGNRPGIILIAGTGDICIGMNADGKVVRSGGWGYLLGDEGSGYHIGYKAINAALKDFDGRGEATSLKKLIELKYKVNSIDEIIPEVYQQKIDRVAIAGLAPMVFEEARKGDSVALEIIKNTGTELGNLVKSVLRKLNFGENRVKVALIGSIFKQKDMLLNEIREELNEISLDIEISDPQFEPSLGAALLALIKLGISIDDNILTNLKDSYFEIIQ